MTLAVCVFIVVNLNGNKSYWEHIFWMPGMHWSMKLFLAPIELIGVFTKPISLMIRLFANITAGHILVLSLICLILYLKRICFGNCCSFCSIYRTNRIIGCLFTSLHFYNVKCNVYWHGYRRTSSCWRSRTTL
jgi:F0F1-type ATP synthase membrane subunit a